VVIYLGCARSSHRVAPTAGCGCVSSHGLRDDGETLRRGYGYMRAPFLQRTACFACCGQVTDSLRAGHQAMVFVHSRKDTGKTGRTLVLKYQNAGESALFDCSENPVHALLMRDVKKSRNKYALGPPWDSAASIRFAEGLSLFESQIAEALALFPHRGRQPTKHLHLPPTKLVTKRAMITCRAVARRELAELAVDGVGIHHAGMLRSDRNLVERLFREGLIKARLTRSFANAKHGQQCRA